MMDQDLGKKGAPLSWALLGILLWWCWNSCASAFYLWKIWMVHKSWFHLVQCDLFLFPLEFWVERVASPCFLLYFILPFSLPLVDGLHRWSQSRRYPFERGVGKYSIQPTWWEGQIEFVKCLHYRWFLKKYNLQDLVLMVSKLISGKELYLSLSVIYILF